MVNLQLQKEEVEHENGTFLFSEILDEKFDALITEKIQKLLSENILDIEKAKVGYHEHDGYPDHPVSVKYHQEYFSGETKEGNASIDIRENEQYEKYHTLLSDKIKDFTRLELTNSVVKKVRFQAILKTVIENKIPIKHFNGLKEIIFSDDKAFEGLSGQWQNNTIVLVPLAAGKGVRENVNFTFVHELGHHVHSKISPILFAQFYERYVEAANTNKGFPSLYSKTNFQEFFAECYASYFLNKEKFKKRNYKMYSLLEFAFKGHK